MSASVHVSPRYSRHSRKPRLRRHASFALVLHIGRVLLRWSLVFASLVGTLGLGLYTQIYDGAYASWIARDLSGAVYALAWCMGLALIRPNARPALVASVALMICTAVELSQLWHPHWLEVIRATHPGRLALGSTFMWSDLAYYAAGAATGALWLRLLPFRARLRDDPNDHPHHGHDDDFVRPMGVRL